VGHYGGLVALAAWLEAANPPDVGHASAEFGFAEVPQASYPPEIQSDHHGDVLNRRPGHKRLTSQQYGRVAVINL